MNPICSKLRFLGAVLTLMALSIAGSLGMRNDTFSREPKRISVPNEPLDLQVNRLQERADRLSAQCDVRPFGWCRDLTTVDISIKSLRGDVSDPILESKRQSLLESRIDVVDRQIKGIENRVHLAE